MHKCLHRAFLFQGKRKMKAARQQEENSVTLLNRKMSLPLVLSTNQALSAGPVRGGREEEEGKEERGRKEKGNVKPSSMENHSLIARVPSRPTLQL